MPRKVRIPVSKEESREAQQRSRARHREYVASLEKRVSEYEKHGVQATQEMQRAARAVAAKNEKLLALLALHGVQQDEINAFLGTPAVPEHPSQHQIRYMSATPVPMAPITSQPAPANNKPSLMSIPQAISPCSQNDMKPTGCRKTTSCGPSAPPTGCTGTQICQPVSEQSCSRAPSIGCGRPNAEVEVTSCEDAASIILNLRGHGDFAETRRELGCANDSTCSVKNTVLFQIMNEMP